MKKKMRILYICSIMPPYAGGAAVDYGMILKSLADNHGEAFEEIRILTERGCNKIKNNKVKLDDILFNYDSVSAAEKSFVKQALNYLVILFYILFTRSNVIQIHARYVYAKYIGRVIFLALLMSPAKVFIDIRDRFYDNFGKYMNFIVCSEELEEYYSWLEKKTFIPVPLISPSSNNTFEQKHQIAYIGSIVENKGVKELLRGFEEYIKCSANPMELHFWGMNLMGADFLNELDDKGKVKYRGIVPNEQIYDIIMRYKAIILPSQSEGMPRICLETMLCKNIIICHKNIKSIAAHVPAGFVLESIQPEEIKNKMLLVEAHKGAIDYCYDFSLHSSENISDKFLELYSQNLDRAASTIKKE